MTMVQEIIYVPTLRCNYNCIHCGQDRECAEVSCEIVRDRLIESNLFQGGRLLITGGEPFLKEGLVQFVVKMLQNGTAVHITTNGSFTESIRELVAAVGDNRQLAFSISIDGTENTHNAIRKNASAYTKAIASLQLIHFAGIYANVNMVVQPANISQMDVLRLEITDKVSPDIPISFIPMIASISHQKDSAFSQRDISKIYPYLDKQRDKKRLLAKEAVVITNCHAGVKNVVISPDACVYTCLTGFSYLGAEERKNFFMGDLKTAALDVLVSQNNLLSWKNTVSSCMGCDNACEWNREEQYFGASFHFSQKEYLQIKQIISSIATKQLQWINGWHPVEVYDWGEIHWMSDLSSKVFYKISVSSAMQLNIRFCNSCPQLPTERCEKPMTLSLIIEGKEVLHNFILSQNGTLQILLDERHQQSEVIELDFVVNQLWRPCDYDGGNDNRNLGVAICSIEAY